MTNSNFSFQPFTAFDVRYKSRVSLSKKGDFGFGSGFLEANNLTSSQSVKLYYDLHKKAVAFLFSNNSEPGSAKLNKRGEKGLYIAALSFFKNYQIDPQRFAGSYEAAVVDDTSLGIVYVIQLQENN